MHDIITSLIDLALYSLDLLIHLDAFLATIVNILLDLVELALKVTNYLRLVPQSVFMVSLAVLDLPLEASDASSQVHDNLRKELEFTLSRLMALDLLSICIDNSIASVLWSNSTNHAGLSRSLLDAHS